MHIKEYEDDLKKFKAFQLKFRDYNPEIIRFATDTKKLMHLALKVCHMNDIDMENLKNNFDAVI